jgi:hypothetical protein
MNPTIKEATIQRYHYDSHKQLLRHLADFVAAYNFGHRLKTLKGLAPYEFICKNLVALARSRSARWQPRRNIRGSCKKGDFCQSEHEGVYGDIAAQD